LAATLRSLALVIVCLCAPGTGRALGPTELGVIINTADALSVRIGRYYAEQRRIPFQNIVEVSFPPGRPAMTVSEFQALKLDMDIHLPQQVQAVALTWAAPYRVECMSITSAVAFGFDLAFCASGCRPTRPSRYFNSTSRLPYRQLGIRLAMSIAARDFDHAMALIDRGVQSDGTRPAGTAYLVSTSDRARNVRSTTFDPLRRALAHRLRVETLQADSIRDKADVLFYFIGRDRVEGLDTLRFVPGAIADHLTSFGGMLTDSSQMSALAWLEAGATGSYGTVVEPCNLPQKFPHPAAVTAHYLRGDTLIEAYWKSVAMPGQGVFVGEPLAAPYRRTPSRSEGDQNSKPAVNEATVALKSPNGTLESRWR
jgi:uncharacterized protein (TIGR03790 family)